MAASRVTLPTPPRRILAVGEGAMMLELEDEMVVLGKTDVTPRRVCKTEEKGERLLWALSADRCATLAPGGIVKIYEKGKVRERRDGLFHEDDELVQTVDAGADRTAVLVGRMTGDPLVLPLPEYRFLIFKNAGQAAGQPDFSMKRKPLGWGVHPSDSTICVAVSEADAEKLAAIPMEKGPARSL